MGLLLKTIFIILLFIQSSLAVAHDLEGVWEGSAYYADDAENIIYHIELAFPVNTIKGVDYMYNGAVIAYMKIDRKQEVFVSGRINNSTEINLDIGGQFNAIDTINFNLLYDPVIRLLGTTESNDSAYEGDHLTIELFKME